MESSSYIETDERTHGITNQPFSQSSTTARTSTEAFLIRSQKDIKS